MAAKAQASVTVTKISDVASVVTWHKLQASTLAKPAKPTGASPSGWTTTEPSYSGDATQTLWTCQCTTLSTGEAQWGEVCKSSSYEAAKAAYNKSVTVETNVNRELGTLSSTVSSVETRLDGLKVGGTNLWVWEGFIHGYLSGTGAAATSGNNDYLMASTIPCEGQTSFIVQSWNPGGLATAGTGRTVFYDADGSILSVINTSTASSTAKAHSCATYQIPAGAKTMRVSMCGPYSVGKPEGYDVKVEFGTMPTAWSPAPEDMATSADMTALQSTVTQQGTSIIQNAGQIALMATKTELTTAVNGVQVGGTNLVTKKAFGGNATNFERMFSKGGTLCSTNVIFENPTLIAPNTGDFSQPNASVNQLGEQVTVSFEHRLAEGGTSRAVVCYPYQNAGLSIADEKYFTPTDEWQSFELVTRVKRFTVGNGSTVDGTAYTYKDSENNTQSRTNGCISVWDRAGTNYYRIRNLKIERGTVATDWSPAPEDVAADATSKADKALADAKTYSDAQLRVQADRITGTVTDVDGLKARTSTLEQTASGLTVSVSKAQGDATQALADAADANANADGVAERADAALRDAQSGINDSIDALSSALTFGLDGLTSSINTVGNDLKTVTTMVRVTQRDQKPLLTLGASNSDAGVDLTNESLEFRVGAQVLASASGSAFSMPVAAVGQSISLGGYMLVAKQGGGFSVKWTGV